MNKGQKFASDLYHNSQVTIHDYNGDVAKYVNEFMELASENDWLEDLDNDDIDDARKELERLARADLG